MTDHSHYERAEDSAIRAELHPGHPPEAELSAQLAHVYATLAATDLLASLVAAVDRLTNAVAGQLPTSHAEVAQAALQQLDGDGSCPTCGTPDLLGHKLTCVRVGQ